MIAIFVEVQRDLTENSISVGLLFFGVNDRQFDFKCDG